MTSQVLPPLPTLREVLRLLNIKAAKRLSQNFLLQPAPIRKIVSSAGNLNNTFVLEVGPGPGCLTREIIKQNPYHLSVVEIDRRFLMPLENLKKYCTLRNFNMDIYNQDILKFNSENIFPDIDKYIHDDQTWSKSEVKSPNNEQKLINIIGNLPFNISTPLLSQWLHDISEKRGLWKYARVPLLLTFQEEVAYRLTADVDNKERCRFSVLCDSLCEIKHCGVISGRTFHPPAKVNTGIVKIIPRMKPIIDVPYPYLDKLVKHIFQYKAKKILNGMLSLFPPERIDLVIQMFERTSVSPESTSIQLTIDDFRLLADEYYQICKVEPEIYDYDFSKRIKKSNLSPSMYQKKVRKAMTGGENLNSDYILSEIKKIRCLS